MYILYGGGVTRAIGPQMVLEEAGLPYDLRIVDEHAQDHRQPAYLAINPAGLIPALVTPEGEVLHEAAGIMLYLAERHGLNDLAPPPGDPQRGLFLTKLFYQTNDIQPAVARFFRPERYSTDPADAAAIRDRARAEALDRWSVLDDFLLANGPCHLGQRFSLPDLHMAMWAAYGLDDVTDVTGRFAGVRRCFDIVMARPRVRPLLEGLQQGMVAWAKAKDAQ